MLTPPRRLRLQSDDEETFVDIDSIQSAIEDNNLQKLKGLMLDIPVESRHPTCMGPHVSNRHQPQLFLMFLTRNLYPTCEYKRPQ